MPARVHTFQRRVKRAELYYYDLETTLEMVGMRSTLSRLAVMFSIQNSRFARRRFLMSEAQLQLQDLCSNDAMM